MFEHVLSSAKIGNLEIKNRFVMPAMGSGHCELDGTVGDESAAYYAARAKGGFGLIITEYVAVDPNGLGARNELCLYDDKFIPGMKRLAEAAHEEGAKIFAQLHHGGRWVDSKITGYPTVSSSPLVWYIRDEIVHELSTDEIYAIIEMFGDAAVRAKKAGIDGVELHGGHGYLIPQFMSALVNKRIDEFGGDILGRSLFPRLIIKNIKEKCGGDYPVCMRISAEESVEGGMKLNEMRAMIKLLEEAGLDAVNVSAGNPSAIGDAGRSMGGYKTPLGFNTDLSEAIKGSVKIPVIAVGRIHDPILADAIIEDGMADFVALGRASIADPEFPRKVLEGRTDEICPCTGCFSRCATAPDENSISAGTGCAFNPFSGNECRMKIEHAEKEKRVVVVGGGVGGLEAAWVLAARGHKVVLLEKNAKPGGQAYTASIPPCKQRFALAIRHYVTMCRKYGVDIRLNTEADADMVMSFNPDAVILATGARPVMLNAPNEGIPVVQAVDVIEGKVVPGHNPIVVGGGLVGLETTELLITMARKITLVEMRDDIGDDPFTKMMHVGPLFDTYVDILTNTAVKRFTKDGAVCSTPDGELMLSGHDMIIMAVGSKAYNPLEKELEGKVSEIYVVGDAKEARRVANAVEEGAWAALKI